MNIRTVRLLDRRPGEGPKVDDPPVVRTPRPKTVAGIAIERDVPLPEPRGRETPAMQALLALEVGESFVHNGSVKTAIHSKPVRKSGRKFTARRLSGPPNQSKRGTFRVWRVS
jgi:hypothetical protein